MTEKTIMENTPKGSRKAQMFNNLVAVYDLLRAQGADTIGEKAVSIAEEIENFDKGGWLKDHSLTDLTQMDVDVVATFLPKTRRKAMLFKALVAFADAAAEHLTDEIMGELALNTSEVLGDDEFEAFAIAVLGGATPSEDAPTQWDDDEPKGDFYEVEVTDTKKVIVFATNPAEAEEEALAIAEDYDAKVTRTAKSLGKA